MSVPDSFDESRVPPGSSLALFPVPQDLIEFLQKEHRLDAEELADHRLCCALCGVSRSHFETVDARNEAAKDELVLWRKREDSAGPVLVTLLLVLALLVTAFVAIYLLITAVGSD